MSNRFLARGNLGGVPELRLVTVDGETRPVADMRLYCDRPVPNGDGGFTDKGGFWLSVSVWGKRGENAARVLDKGMRIRAEGTLIQNTWEQDGEKFSRLEMAADDVTLDLSRIESVRLRERNRQESDDGDVSEPGAIPQ